MNVGSKIDFNKSSLLSLKAELIKKHEEATNIKSFSRNKSIKKLSKPPKDTTSNVNVQAELSQDHNSGENFPDLHASRAALEAKADLYDKLSANIDSLNDESCFLVDFSKKTDKYTQIKHQTEDKDEDSNRVETDSDEYGPPSDPEDDWVEYTDCLGRSRRCLRRDLEDIKTRDAKLFESLKPATSEHSVASPQINDNNASVGCVPPDLYSEDMRREQQRQKWEEQEMRIRNKSGVHYQDVLFDEARQHGVGYFAFSTDEAERRAQQAMLKNFRAETEKQQAATNAARQRRAQLLNKRLRAAYNRKRVKEGLPPLADDEELPQTDRADSPPPAPETEDQKDVAAESVMTCKQRLASSVRPWDIGKEGVMDKPGPVMSQKEWVTKKREDRQEEFAPPSFYEDRNPSEHLNPSAVGLFARLDDSLSEQPKDLNCTSNKKRKIREELNRKPMAKVGNFPHKTGSSAEELPSGLGHRHMESMEDLHGNLRRHDHPRSSSFRKGAEIPPPSLMEYFAPSKTLRSTNPDSVKQPSTVELEKSISAGLSFLRQQQEEKEKLKEKGLLGVL